MNKGIVIVGAGGHAKVVVALFKTLGLEVEAILDDNEQLWGQELWGVGIHGPVDRARQFGFQGIVAVGSNRRRKKLVNELDLEWVSAVHPDSWIHSSVQIGSGTVVLPGGTIEPGVTVGDHAIVNTGANIGHDSTVGSFAHIGPGASLAGSVSVGDGVLFGVGSSAIPGVCVGSWTIIGAGAAVVTDIEPGVTAIGVPAKALKGKQA